jgi:hypothetical protein
VLYTAETRICSVGLYCILFLCRPHGHRAAVSESPGAANT